MGAFPAGFGKLFIRSRNKRLVFSLGNRAKLLAHIRNLIGIFYYHLKGDILSKIGELLKHFIGGAKIDRHFIICVGHLEAREKNSSVYLVLFIEEMGIAGSANGLTKLLAQAIDLAIDLAKVLLAVNSSLSKEEFIIGYRLNLKIIVELRDVLYVLIGSSFKDRAVKLTLLAGRTNYKSVAVLLDNRLGHSRSSAVIIKITEGDQTIEVLKTFFIFCENYHMIDRKLQGVCLFAHCINHSLEGGYTLALKSIKHYEEDVCKSSGIIAGSVMMEFLKLVMLGYNIELMLCKLGIYIFGKSYCIKIGVCKRNLATLCGYADEAYVEVCIMSNKKSIACELHKRLESFLFLWRAFNIVISYGREVGYFLADLAFGINEHIEFVNDLSTFDLNRADLDDLTGAVRKTCGLEVEYYHFVIEARIFATKNATLGIVYVICFDSVKNFKIIVFCLFIGEHNFRVCLNVSVVSNGDSAMPPSDCCIDNLLGSYERVHLRHIRV